MPEVIVLHSIKSALERVEIQTGLSVNAPKIVEPFLEDRRRPQRFEVLGSWWLVPLHVFAYHLALDKEPPEPANSKEPPDLWISLAYWAKREDGQDLLFPQLLNCPEGIYVPLPESDLVASGTAVFGSSIALRGECVALLRELGVPGDYERVAEELRSEAKWMGGQEPWQRYRFETSGALTLLQACEKSIELRCGMAFEHEYYDPPEGVVLSHLSASYFGLGDFESGRIVEGGRFIVATFFSGWRYRVPVALLAWRSGVETPAPDRVLATEVRLDPRFTNVLGITLEAGEEIDASADNILSLCEPSFEEFGEWKGESAEIVAKWNREHGPFRIDTKKSPTAPSTPTASKGLI